MDKTIKPSKLFGILNAPASKSIMQRAIAAGLLSSGTTVLKNPTFCNDSIAAMDVAENLGATINQYEDYVVIKGNGKIKKYDLDCGESGLCIRMFTPIAATFNSKLSLYGSGTLLTRPVYMLEEPLKMLGAECTSNSGFPPINVKGPLKGGIVKIDGSISSQILTGFLFATPLSENDSELIVANLKSKPYIDLTINVLKDFGIEIINENYEVFKIKGNQQFKAREYFIEGDWSGIAFFMVGAAISGKIEIKNLNINSLQADKFILNALEKAGAKFYFKNNSIFVENNELKAFNFDATHCPDLFPPLVALAASCCGVTEIKGVSRLKFKESDRANVLKTEFLKLGIEIELKNDLMLVHGGKIKGGIINSHNDHRIAMAGAIAGLNSENQVVIQNAECVAKSYPEFFQNYSKLGGISF